jgi:ELWxxDGT repeat protein
MNSSFPTSRDSYALQAANVRRSHWCSRLLVVIAMLLLGSALPAQGAGPAVLISDINPKIDRSNTTFSSPGGLLAVGRTLYFTAEDEEHGRELWKSDGTPDGTVLVKDINLGVESGFPADCWYRCSLANVAETLFFLATDGSTGYELWRSDGTAGGTTLVKDIRPGLESAFPYECINQRAMVSVNGRLFFSADDGVHGCELWQSDGTATGTVLVKDILPGAGSSAPAALANVNGILFFSADNGSNGRELWRSSVASTVQVADINVGAGSSNPERLTDVNGYLFFIADNGTLGKELWKSPITGAPTLVKDIYPGSSGAFANDCADHCPMINVNGTLFFSARDDIHGFELWKSDGTPGGTQLVKDIYQFQLGGRFPVEFTNVNGSLFFVASDDNLWKSDGTEAGTVMVKSFSVLGISSPTGLTNVNGLLFFSGDDGTTAGGVELWRSDGTEAGTYMVKDINPIYYSSPSQLTNVNGTLFFIAEETFINPQLWKSNGTELGTVKVGAIRAEPQSSSPSELIAMNDTIFFRADDGASGAELWKTNARAVGVERVQDIEPGASGSQPEELTNVNGTLFFTADEPGREGRELWKSDGTQANTRIVKEINTCCGDAFQFNARGWLTNVNGTLFFRANDGSTGDELYKSDGTPAGTGKVKELRPGREGSEPLELTAINGMLFFTAIDSLNDRELWRSDGTETGTVRVKDIKPTGWSEPIGLTNVNGTLFFQATNGQTSYELWKSDGTEAGTVQVLDINPGGPSYPLELTNVNNTLFFIADDGQHGRELWKSDGTPDGTMLVKDIVPDIGSPFPRTTSNTAFVQPPSLTAVNAEVFFVADGGQGFELWKSDGTPEGTVLVKDINPGAEGSIPAALTNVDGTLLFSATDGSSGRELWRSDGTDTGTVLVQDLAPGRAASTPTELLAVGPCAFFSADNGSTGHELWALLDPMGCYRTYLTSVQR